MSHTFVEWPGFVETRRYCKHCGDWENEAFPFRCKAEAVSPRAVSGSVSELARKEEDKYPWTLSTILDSFAEDELSQINWNGYTAFSSSDNITVLEFTDGIKETPKSLAKYNGNHCGRLGKSFRFSRIRSEWKQKYGLTADEYIDVSTPKSSSSVSPTNSTGARHSNTAAGIAPGSQHGFDPTTRLGTVPDSLAHRLNCLASLRDDGLISQRMFTEALRTIDDGQDT